MFIDHRSSRPFGLYDSRVRIAHRGDVAGDHALITIDITLAGLFWAMGRDTDIIGGFLTKVLLCLAPFA